MAGQVSGSDDGQPDVAVDGHRMRWEECKQAVARPQCTLLGKTGRRPGLLVVTLGSTRSAADECGLVMPDRMSLSMIALAGPPPYDCVGAG